MKGSDSSPRAIDTLMPPMHFEGIPVFIVNRSQPDTCQQAEPMDDDDAKIVRAQRPVPNQFEFSVGESE